MTPVFPVSCSGWMGSVAGVLLGASGWVEGIGFDVKVEVLGVSSVEAVEAVVSVDVGSARQIFSELGPP